MTSSIARRVLSGVALAGATVMLLAACSPFDILRLGSRAVQEVDTAAIAEAVTATSDTIDMTYVETRIDGLTTHLWVAPVLTSDGLTADELDAVLRVAFEMSRGQVEAIEVHTMNSNEDTIDVSTAASELGIQRLDNQNSVTYSTVYLEERYGQ